MPKPIRALASELLDNPRDVAVTPQSTPVERIEQAVMLMDKPEKRPFVVQALENQFRTIIFTRTKHGADQLVKYLSKQGVTASAIHGNKSQNARQRTLDAFRKGEEHILIATDIAARGIDIPDVSLVVNYDVPTTPEAYVHRIGRTARAGREGRAITLCAPEEQKHLRDIERLIKIKLPIENVQAGEIDENAYNPMKAVAKPASKTAAKPAAKSGPKKHRKGGSAHRTTERTPERPAERPAERKAEKSDSERFDKKRKPKDRKPAVRRKAEAGQASKNGQQHKRGEQPRKKGGNKNPPRGPARNRTRD